MIYLIYNTLLLPYIYYECYSCIFCLVTSRLNGTFMLQMTSCLLNHCFNYLFIIVFVVYYSADSIVYISNSVKGVEPVLLLVDRKICTPVFCG